jgi:hypothetical protein
MPNTSLWFRLNVDWHESPWLAALPWEVRAVWPVLLGHIKQHGHRGSIRTPIPSRFCAQYDLPESSYSALIAAATEDGALRIVTDSNGKSLRVTESVTVVTHWEDYQYGEPLSNAERQKRYRDKTRSVTGDVTECLPIFEPETSRTVTDRNGTVTKSNDSNAQESRVEEKRREEGGNSKLVSAKTSPPSVSPNGLGDADPDPEADPDSPAEVAKRRLRMRRQLEASRQ